MEAKPEPPSLDAPYTHFAIIGSLLEPQEIAGLPPEVHARLKEGLTVVKVPRSVLLDALRDLCTQDPEFRQD